MCKTFILLICIASTSAVAIEASQHAAPRSQSADNAIQLAQACGWYAIYSCSRSRSEAQRIASRFGGRVIHTSSNAYPNFRPGYFCTVEGPMGRGAAVSMAARLRSSGVARDAYAKSAC